MPKPHPVGLVLGFTRGLRSDDLAMIFSALVARNQISAVHDLLLLMPGLQVLGVSRTSFRYKSALFMASDN